MVCWQEWLMMVITTWFNQSWYTRQYLLIDNSGHSWSLVSAAIVDYSNPTMSDWHGLWKWNGAFAKHDHSKPTFTLLNRWSYWLCGQEQKHQNQSLIRDFEQNLESCSHDSWSGLAAVMAHLSPEDSEPRATRRWTRVLFRDYLWRELRVENLCQMRVPDHQSRWRPHSPNKEIVWRCVLEMFFVGIQLHSVAQVHHRCHALYEYRVIIRKRSLRTQLCFCQKPRWPQRQNGMRFVQHAQGIMPICKNEQAKPFGEPSIKIPVRGKKTLLGFGLPSESVPSRSIEDSLDLLNTLGLTMNRRVSPVVISGQPRENPIETPHFMELLRMAVSRR